jgi:hypothetical protein
VAAYSTGIVATWGTTAFVEVVDLSWTYGGGPSKGRSVVWTDDAGSVSITCLGSANTGIGEYGLRKTLALSGGGQALTLNAVWESLSVAPELNGVTKFTVTFRLLDQ